MTILYRKGDATNPHGMGPKVIVHCCNNIGAFSAGFALAVANKWPLAQEEYFKLFQTPKPPELGHVQFVYVKHNLWVANLIGQVGVGKRPDGTPPIDYPAILKGLKTVKKFAKEYNAAVIGPRFGSGLAGGDWSEIEKIINKVFNEPNVPVTIYDL